MRAQWVGSERRAAVGDVVARAVEGVGGGGFDDVRDRRRFVVWGGDWLGGEQHGGGDGAERGNAGGDQAPSGEPVEERVRRCGLQLGGGGAEQDPILPGRTKFKVPADYPQDLYWRGAPPREEYNYVLVDVQPGQATKFTLKRFRPWAAEPFGTVELYK